MTVMLIKLKVLNVEFKALHVVTPVHHSRLNLGKKKKKTESSNSALLKLLDSPHLFI